MIWQVTHCVECFLEANGEAGLDNYIHFFADLSVRIGTSGKDPLIISREPKEASHYSRQRTVPWNVWKRRILARFRSASYKTWYRDETFVFLEFLRKKMKR